MGQLMRRYWVPALLSWEVVEPDGAPVALQLLGEDLVAFRQTDGRVGLVAARCPHRGASLFWGRNEACGLRCVYHGWKFDLTGQCVDMPSEPAATNFQDKVRIPAYPTYEVGGVIWTYMGPPAQQPAPPLFEWTQAPETHRGVTKVWQECNWLQALEGGLDTVHSNFLHFGKPAPTASIDTGSISFGSNTVRGRAVGFSQAAVVEVVPTDYGYTYGGIRRLPDASQFVRGYHWIMPWTQLRGYSLDVEKPEVDGHMWVPIDDENTMVWNFRYTYGAQPLTETERALAGTGNQFDVDVDRDTFRALRNQRNRYLIDRRVQRTQTYTGIVGVNTQDRAVQESMGPIADRTSERLGTTDRAIIRARQLLLAALEQIEVGDDPPGVAPSYYRLRALEQVVPKDVPWFDAMRPALLQCGDEDLTQALVPGDQNDRAPATR
jgi:phenylpropionate dioxygenase-like ring-hydroxylating dioxygenase large terminal subunit